MLKVNLLMIKKILLLFFLAMWIIKITAVSPASLLNCANFFFPVNLTLSAKTVMSTCM